ncbi:MAG: CRISPR-associated protein Csx15 [Blastocatellia bacterium]
MHIINFSHPLTKEQCANIERLTGQTIACIIDVKTQFDNTQPFVEQVRAMIDIADLASEDWQTTPLLINLPSLNVIAALLLAELHGRCGYFPAILRLRPVAGITPPQFEVAEILNLQSVRDLSRASR